MKEVFITGGGGYVGCHLADYLVENGYSVTVYDLFIYGENVFKFKDKIKKIKGDIRDIELLKNSLKDKQIVIHLACISNDPSFELNPKLGKSINFDAFEPLVMISKKLGVERFIYASSSSVYGLKTEINVHEKISLDPLTDYSKYKAMCEKILAKYNDQNFCTTVIRPATVCGYSKRQRLDLIVNILTNLGYHNRKISVFGGEQLRPNIHINDMVRAYKVILEAPSLKISGEIFNAGWENKSVIDIANLVKSEIGDDVELIISPTDDNRSYHISSEKIKDVLKFKTEFTISDAVKDLIIAFKNKILIDTLENSTYFNIKQMQKIQLK